MKKEREQSVNKATYVLITLLLPVVGIVLGIILLSKQRQSDKKLGETTLAFSVLFSILWGALFYFFLPATIGVSSKPTTDSPVALESSPESAELKKYSLGESAQAEGIEITLIEVNDNVDIGYPPQNSDSKYVQVKAQLRNIGSTAISDNANLRFGATRSDRQSASIAFSATNTCTNFNHGSYSLEAGASATGCIYFEVPKETHLSHVFFNEALGSSSVPALSWEL